LRSLFINVEVETVCADEFLSDSGKSISLIKVDVEVVEPLVLRG
jgi:hypothetical protein